MREVYSAAICKTLEDIGVWGTNMDIQELTRGLVNLISYNSEMTFASYPKNDQEIAVKVSRQPDGNPQVETQVATLIP
jgi:hypothetical protein